VVGFTPTPGAGDVPTRSAPSRRCRVGAAPAPLRAGTPPRKETRCTTADTSHSPPQPPPQPPAGAAAGTALGAAAGAAGAGWISLAALRDEKRAARVAELMDTSEPSAAPDWLFEEFELLRARVALPG
jgi:hypothetical protein